MQFSGAVQAAEQRRKASSATRQGWSKPRTQEGAGRAVRPGGALEAWPADGRGACSQVGKGMAWSCSGVGGARDGWRKGGGAGERHGLAHRVLALGGGGPKKVGGGELGAPSNVNGDRVEWSRLRLIPGQSV
jgi:hypothetical protein